MDDDGAFESVHGAVGGETLFGERVLATGQHRAADRLGLGVGPQAWSTSVSTARAAAMVSGFH